MATAVLTAHAIPTRVLVFDHTYVTSSLGHAWGCWGRSQGGEALCSGDGDPEKADCLSRGADEAGIIYGRTGVCHQMANRILWPARITVVEARGARLSIFRYGAYGKELRTRRRYHPITYPWPELGAC